MRGKQVSIELEPEIRRKLEKFSATGRHRVRLVNRAKIILELDQANGRKPASQEVTARKIEVSRRTINDAKRAFLAAEDLSVFLQGKKRETPPVAPKVTGELEAHSVATASGKVPEGRAKRTLRLIAETCVELDYVDSISHMSIARLLKKRSLSLA